MAGPYAPEDFEVLTPRSVAEALRLLAERPLRPLAGGTDLMVLLGAGRLPPGAYLNLWSLDELRGVAVEERQVTLGALTTYTALQAEAVLQAEFPMLCQAASVTGGWAIQNRGTLGGNLANASPAADSSPALLCYDAELELWSAAGRRVVPYGEFHLDYRKTALRPDELIARVRLPRDPGRSLHRYRKVGPRRMQAISKVCFAGCASFDGAGALRAVRVALGGVAKVVLRCPGAEAALLAGDRSGARDRSALVAAVEAALLAEIAPIDDIRSTARYRRRVAQNLLRDFMDELAALH